MNKGKVPRKLQFSVALYKGGYFYCFLFYCSLGQCYKAVLDHIYCPVKRPVGLSTNKTWDWADRKQRQWPI